MRFLNRAVALSPLFIASFFSSSLFAKNVEAQDVEATASLAAPLDDPDNDRFFPIWGQEARAKGYEIPKTYGLSLSYLYMDQPLNINSIAIGGTPLLDQISQSIFDDYLDISDADQDASNYTLRADMWLFPFLNVYGLVGYTKGSSQAPITCRADRPTGILAGAVGNVLNSEALCGHNPDETRKIADFDLDYQGPTYGIGVTFAGGFDNWFSILDMNYSRTDLDILKGKINSLVISPRVGYRFEPNGKELRVWVGGMYQKIEQDKQGKLSDILSDQLLAVIPNSDKGTWKVEQELEAEWNTTIGGNYLFNRNWDLVAELGFGPRKSAFMALEYRY